MSQCFDAQMHSIWLLRKLLKNLYRSSRFNFPVSSHPSLQRRVPHTTDPQVSCPHSPKNSSSWSVYDTVSTNWSHSYLSIVTPASVSTMKQVALVKMFLSGGLDARWWGFGDLDRRQIVVGGRVGCIGVEPLTRVVGVVGNLRHSGVVALLGFHLLLRRLGWKEQENGKDNC